MAKKKRVLLKKLAKHNTMWHPDSRLVFKSKKDKLVIGRLDDQNELLSADELTLELCEQWNFKMDPSLVEDDDSETEEGASDASVDETAPAPETVDAARMRRRHRHRWTRRRHRKQWKHRSPPNTKRNATHPRRSMAKA
jgi:hypothetical protein